MTQSFSKVTAGQPYHGFPADMYNALVDVVNAYRGGQLSLNPKSFDTVRSSGIVQIKNNTGGSLGRLSVVGLGDPIFSPTADQEEFRNRVRFKGETPLTSHEPDKFAILLQPLNSSEVGYGCVAGVTVAKVYINDASHQYAAVEASNTSSLNSTSARGGAQILWKPAGEYSTLDCIIRIPTSPPDVAIVKITSGSCTEPEGYEFGCYWEATIAEPDISGLTFCDPWGGNAECYVIATNECEDLSVMKLRGGERFIGVYAGKINVGYGEKPLYSIMAPHGKVRVNEEDKLDYLEDQYQDHVDPGEYESGDLLVNSQTNQVSGDYMIRRYVDCDDYELNYEQALTHPSGSSKPKWVRIHEVDVITDLRIYNNEIQKRTSTVKVLSNTDNDWSTALPATEC